MKRRYFDSDRRKEVRKRSYSSRGERSLRSGRYRQLKDTKQVFGYHDDSYHEQTSSTSVHKRFRSPTSTSGSSISKRRRTQDVNDRYHSSHLSAAEHTLEGSSSSGVCSFVGSEVRANKTSRSGEDGNYGHQDFPVVYTASLPDAYYSIGNNKVVRESEELNKLQENFQNILQLFTRTIPQRCSLMDVILNSSSSSETKLKGKEGADKGGIDGKKGTGEIKNKEERENIDSKEETESTEIKEKEKDKQKSNNSQTEDEEMKDDTELLHKHLPRNHPGKVSLYHCSEKYHDFGKVTDLGITLLENWYCYQIVTTPTINFKFGGGVTRITTPSGEVFTFEGFSVLSRHSLDTLPKCTFERYGGQYVIELRSEPIHKNYTFKDLLLFEEFLFVKLLEMFDWMEYLKPFCKDLFFFPRFCRSTGCAAREILSMAEVLKYLVDTYQPLEERDFRERRQTCWMEGLLVAQHHKTPSCVRIDRVSFPSAKSKRPVLDHFCSQLQRKARNHSIDCQKDGKRRCKELHLISEKRTLSQKEYFEFKALKHKFSSKGSVQSHSQCGEDHLATLSWKGFHRTGLYFDISQNILPLSFLSHHILLYDSLKILQVRIGYHFKDPQLLHRALTHPSCTTSSFMVAEDHVRNALSNCGLCGPEFLRTKTPKVSKGIKGLQEAVKITPTDLDEVERLQNNEQLEFLGDAVLEFLCSNHLYHNHPDHSVGKLTHDRQLLVKNKHLCELAEKLRLSDFMLRNLKAEFTEESTLHFLSNSVEAILGAVFLDGGLEDTDRVFARLAFPEKEKFKQWMEYDNHPLQTQFPDGDRHLVEESDILKSMVPLEETTGITFKNITLLTKAFIHSSCTDTKITGGNYQRLEFLGDAILQFLVSKFVYNRFPSHNEGHLSLVRTSLVHNKQLATICQEMGFDKFIITSKTEKVELSIKIMADVVESFLAALALDKGLERAERFLEEHLYPKLQESVTSSQLVDANTRLNQAAAFTCKQQGVKLELPVFRLVKTEGATDKPTFTISVHMGKKKLGVGSGSSMREARSNASEEALQSGMLRIPPAQKQLYTNK